MTDTAAADTAAEAPPESPDIAETASVYESASRPDGEVLVSPRYLAGGGLEADDAFNPLISQAGWHHWVDELANCDLTSPCGRGYLGFLPEPNPEHVGLWKAWVRPSHHGARTWMAAFGDEAPYEFIQAFTTAWAASYNANDDGFAAPGDTDSQAIDKVLRVAGDAGWEHDYFAENGLKRLTAPDGRAAIELRTWVRNSPEHETLQGYARWTIWAAPAPYRRPVWEATFTTGTPADLVAAFVKALVATDPLMREEHMIPRAAWQHVTRT
ncbi:DUF317 domain-containing protein [Kitasatospora sp. NPDC001175]|uniref:DUF317 domain-containing protein n=1 Tax=Kitasatospora sp. NPDC001175 TaxID=3157103 RepID=UPI003D08E341